MTPGVKSRTGRKRWGELVKFLTLTMKTSGSERVRMQAADRLADVLTVREQREQLELRRDLRQPTPAQGAAQSTAQSTAPADERESAELAADTFLSRIRAERQEREQKEMVNHEQ